MRSPIVDHLELKQSHFPAHAAEAIWETTVGELLRITTKTNPAGSALVEVTTQGTLGRRWTYTELLVDSERLAAALASRFQPGERIIVWAPSIPEWVMMEYACALAGLVLVAANPAYQAKELRHVLEHSEAVGLFLVESYRGNPMADIAQDAIRDLDALREVIDLNNHEILFRTGDSAGALPAVQPGDAAQIQYTSGTTGFPNGVPRDVSSLQVVSSGGSMVAPELVSRVQSAFGCGFSTLYG